MTLRVWKIEIKLKTVRVGKNGDSAVRKLSALSEKSCNWAFPRKFWIILVEIHLWIECVIFSDSYRVCE